MWVMLMSSCALIRTLMLRFVILYASTKVNSYAMKFISYLWCIIRCYLCLMLGYEVIRFLVGRFSIFLLAFILHQVWSLLVHPNSFKPVLPYESTISTYMQYYFAVLRKFACAISNFQHKFLFYLLYRSRGGEGWPIFSMLDVLFSRWLFIHLSLHDSMAKVLGMPSPEMKNDFT